MDLQDPNEIEVGSETEVLLGDARDELNEFIGLGEFTPDVQEQIRREFLPQRISDTLNIEGVRVNPRITRAILEGQALAETDRYGEEEVINAIKANDFVEVQAREAEPISASHIREVNRLVCDGLFVGAGGYREREVEITGAAFRPPSINAIPGLVQQLCELNSQAERVNPIIRSCWLHVAFAAIHPFLDGNGRTGRLLQDWILIQHGYLPVGIPASRREEYYDALHAADGGRWELLVSLVANSELTALERARRIAEAPKQRLQRIRSLVQASQQTVRQRDYNKYEVWRRRVDGVRDEFQRWTADLNAESPDLRIDVKVWDPISFQKWQEIRERGMTRGTWLFSLRFVFTRRAIFSWLFYARRHEFSYTLEYEQLEPGIVGVFLTGAPEPGSHYEFGQFSDPYVSLRELIYVGDSLHVYREPRPGQVEGAVQSEAVSVDLSRQGRWVSETGSPAGVVESFLEECLLKFGLIGG
jgi:Fic family protein